MKRWVVFITLFLFSILISLFPTALYAQETGKVASVEEGERAPFAGTLFSPEGLSKFVAEKEFKWKKKNLKLQKELDLLKEKQKFIEDSYERQIKDLKDNYEIMLKRQEETVKVLKNIALERDSTPHFWIGIGVGGGAAVLVTGTVLILVGSAS